MAVEELRSTIAFLADGNVMIFAGQTGVSRQTVYRWLNGRSPVPSTKSQYIRRLVKEKELSIALLKKYEREIQGRIAEGG